jgi:predicted nucleotidyltransferase
MPQPLVDLAKPNHGFVGRPTDPTNARQMPTVIRCPHAMASRISSQVLQTLRALEPELRAAGVRHVSVFGSVARGEDTASSDVDLALDLVPDTTPSGFQFVVYVERLKDKLATALRRNVDIMILPARRQELKEALGREAIPAF